MLKSLTFPDFPPCRPPCLSPTDSFSSHYASFSDHVEQVAITFLLFSSPFLKFPPLSNPGCLFFTGLPLTLTTFCLPQWNPVPIPIDFLASPPMEQPPRSPLGFLFRSVKNSYSHFLFPTVRFSRPLPFLVAVFSSGSPA